MYASKRNPILKALPQVVSKDLFGWTLEYDPVSKTFVYFVCTLSPAGTPVPDGFAHRGMNRTGAPKAADGTPKSIFMRKK